MTDNWGAQLLRARERLLTGGRIEEIEGPSAEILASWRRSSDDGVDANKLNTSYVENVNLASRLARAASSVVDGVAEDVAGSPVSAILADSRGRVLLRRSGVGDLERGLDSVMLAPGFSYAEHHVGTNGIGSALEGRGAYAVCGHEPFSEPLQDFACFGVPVRDPFSHRFVGVLDITTWAGCANPALGGAGATGGDGDRGTAGRTRRTGRADAAGRVPRCLTAVRILRTRAQRQRLDVHAGGGADDRRGRAR